MNDHEIKSKQDGVVSALRELVDALGRRVGQVGRDGEARIAREATALRKEALKRIREVTQAAGEPDRREAEEANAVMSDDGAPSGRPAGT